MLNYQELSVKFTEELAKFDSASLSAWIEYDYQRDVLRKLSDGVSVWIKSDTVSLGKHENCAPSTEFATVSDTPTYSMAA
jgi:hypothetical protein